MEEIAKAIARHERVRILPSGVYSLNKLGLSTQAPTKLVYITDGPPRMIKLGKGGIRFKATSAKKFKTGHGKYLLFKGGTALSKC